MSLKRAVYRRRARKRLPHLDREDANLLGDFTDVVTRYLKREIRRQRFSRRNLTGLAVVLSLPAIVVGYVLVEGMP